MNTKMPAPVGNQFAKGSGEGRPSEYDVKYVQDVYDYINETIEHNRGISKDGIRNEFRLPTLEGYAVRIRKTKQTLLNWANADEDFFDALEFLRSNQCVELVNGGLNGRLNPTIAKLILSSNHGMRDGQDVTSGGEKLNQPTTIIFEDFSEDEEEK